MIIPSKQVLLISVPEKKEVFMFDPKTACVLQTYSTQSQLAATAGYFQLGQQFLIPHLNNTYVNVWDTDARQPRKFSVGEGEKISCLKMLEGNILLLGSSHGNLYVYQLPSGILIKKVQLHSQSSEVKTIIFLKQMGYIVTGTRKQLKQWPLRDIIGDQKPVAEKTIHSVIQIIAVELIREILCVVTERTLNFYYACNFSMFTLNKDFQQLQNVTCACSSPGSLFVGDALGRVRQIVINPHEKQLLFEERKGKVLLQNKKALQIEIKQPISALAYVSSLQYLVAANYKGEVKMWHQGNLKNSVQLAKSSINLVFVIPRPSKEKKIPQSHKIKSLHKQQLTKVEQPIVFDSGNVNYIEQNTEFELGEDVYLERMLELLNDREELLETEIEMVRKQNKQLLQANLHYFTVLDQASEGKNVNSISR